MLNIARLISVVIVWFFVFAIIACSLYDADIKEITLSQLFYSFAFSILITPFAWYGLAMIFCMCGGMWYQMMMG